MTVGDLYSSLGLPKLFVITSFVSWSSKPGRRRDQETPSCFPQEEHEAEWLRGVGITEPACVTAGQAVPCPVCSVRSRARDTLGFSLAAIFPRTFKAAECRDSSPGLVRCKSFHRLNSNAGLSAPTAHSQLFTSLSRMAAKDKNKTTCCFLENGNQLRVSEN
jgi:hypothetical protein